MKRIALDLDGVVYNYSKTACFLLNYYKGYSLDWEKTTHWEWLQQQVTHNHWMWLWSKGVELGLFRYGNLITGAIEGIRELSKLGAVIVTTSRPPSAVQDTMDWLSFMKFPIEGLHILGRSGIRKADLVPKFDLAIDDSPTEIQAYVDKGVPIVVYRYPYNDAVCVGLPWEYQAWNWKEVVEKARAILK